MNLISSAHVMGFNSFETEPPLRLVVLDIVSVLVDGVFFGGWLRLFGVGGGVVSWFCKSFLEIVKRASGWSLGFRFGCPRGTGDGSADDTSESSRGLYIALEKLRFRGLLAAGLMALFLFVLELESRVFFLTALFLLFFFDDTAAVRGWPADRVLLATRLSNGLAPSCFVPRGGEGSGDGALSLAVLTFSVFTCFLCFT